jgi:hypothetical protein
MKTIWRWIDEAGTVHMTTDIDEAQEHLSAKRFILGAIYNE